MTTQCTQCGSEYKSLGQHWSRSPNCSFPEISQKKKEIIQGLLIGDGSVEDRGASGRFSIELSNEEFIQWIDETLGILSLGYSLNNSAKGQKQRADDQGYLDVKEHHEFNDTYRLRTRAHTYFQDLRKWYDGGSKSVPENSELTPLKVKMWYVCDGSLVKSDKQRPHSRIYTSKSEEEIQRLISLLDEGDIEPKQYKGSIGFTADGTEQFLDWIGEPPAGMEYKWIGHDT
jgi:hypothetical protein